MDSNKQQEIICYCIRLRRATSHVTKHYDELLRPCGVTVNQFSLLRNLNRIGVCSISELASHVGLEKSTLVRSLKPLLEAGFVEDISQPGSRDSQMRVTLPGMKVIEQGSPLWDQAQAEMEEVTGGSMPLLLNLLSEMESLP